MPKTETNYLSLAEAAEHLGVAPLTLRRAISRGELRAYRYGKKIIRVRREDLDALLRPIPSARSGGHGAA